MTQQQWKDLVYNTIDISTIDGQMMKCLAQLPDLMDRGRHALRSLSLPDPVLVGIQEEVRDLRHSFGSNLESLRNRWIDTDSSIAMQYPGFMQQKPIIHAHFSRSYGMALALGIILNCMLAALDGNISEFDEESSQLSNEVLNLAEIVDQYRPLGTMYMILCLVAAWVGTKGWAQRAFLKMRLTSYIKDVHGPSAKGPSADLERIEKRFYLK